MTVKIVEGIKTKARKLADQIAEIIVSEGYNIRKGDNWKEGYQTYLDIENPERVKDIKKYGGLENYFCMIGHILADDSGLKVDIRERGCFEKLKDPLEKFLAEKESLDFDVEVCLISEEPGMIPKRRLSFSLRNLFADDYGLG